MRMPSTSLAMRAARSRTVHLPRREKTAKRRTISHSILRSCHRSNSIGADTNIAAFLRRDVPPELTRAALRRAWTSDPAIKNFVGLVENGWDFNDPSAMSGFGPISAEEVARLAGKVIEALPEAAPEDQTKEVSTSEKKSQLAKTNALPAGPLEAAPKSEESGCDTGNDAAQQNETGNKS